MIYIKRNYLQDKFWEIRDSDIRNCLECLLNNQPVDDIILERLAEDYGFDIARVDVYFDTLEIEIEILGKDSYKIDLGTELKEALNKCDFLELQNAFNDAVHKVESLKVENEIVIVREH